MPPGRKTAAEDTLRVIDGRGEPSNRYNECRRSRHKVLPRIKPRRDTGFPWFFRRIRFFYMFRLRRMPRMPPYFPLSRNIPIRNSHHVPVCRCFQWFIGTAMKNAKSGAAILGKPASRTPHSILHCSTSAAPTPSPSRTSTSPHDRNIPKEAPLKRCAPLRGNARSRRRISDLSVSAIDFRAHYTTRYDQLVLAHARALLTGTHPDSHRLHRRRPQPP